MRGLLAVLAIAGLSVTTACSGSDDEAGRTPSVPSTSSTSSDDGETGPPPGNEPNLEPEVVLQGLDVPWGIAFLPDGSALIAQRNTANVLLFGTDDELVDLGEIEGVTPTSEGGLLGLAVSPQFDVDQTVFAYLTTEADNRVVRMTLDGTNLSDPTPILTGIPRGEIHDGGRLEFGPDGKLYVTTGETGNGELAQDPESLGGKILRINTDGSVPADNPDPDSPVWTLGHRNVQGIAWDDDGRMFASEFGDSTWDELNLIEPGNNYGWPEAEGRSDIDGFTNPLEQWSTEDLSPSGLAYLDGSLYIAGLRGQRLYRLPVRNSGSLGAPEALYEGEYGRLRTVVATPDGTLWFSTSNRDGRASTPFPKATDDRLFEIAP